MKIKIRIKIILDTDFESLLILPISNPIELPLKEIR